MVRNGTSVGEGHDGMSDDMKESSVLWWIEEVKTSLLCIGIEVNNEQYNSSVNYHSGSPSDQTSVDEKFGINEIIRYISAYMRYCDISTSEQYVILRTLSTKRNLPCIDLAEQGFFNGGWVQR